MVNPESSNIQDICPVCHSSEISLFMEITDAPVHCNLLYRTRDEAIVVPKGDIRLGFCLNCGHVFNLAFNPDLMKYSGDYENSLHHSPRFQAYAESLAKRLIESYDLNQKDIIEIGCGNGDFLRLLCNLGGNHGIGFDPSFFPDSKYSAEREGIVFIQDFYSENYANYKADFVCCRHVLEHIQFPRDFLCNLQRAIGPRMSTALFFEVPNVMFTLRELGIWDVIYEHCAYFSKCSLAYLFSSLGFNILSMSEAFEGQFLCMEAILSEVQADSRYKHRDDLRKIAQDVAAFAHKYSEKVTHWRRELESLKNLGKRVIIWGVGSKGVTFLNTLKADQIQYVVDINPHKQGKHVAGTGQRIVSPKFLHEYRPGVIILMNPIYRREVEELVRELDLSCTLIPA